MLLYSVEILMEYVIDAMPLIELLHFDKPCSSMLFELGVIVLRNVDVICRVCNILKKIGETSH